MKKPSLAGLPSKKMIRRIVVSSNSRLDIGARSIPGFILGFRWCSFGGRRRSHRLRGACGDLVKSQDAMPAQSLGGAHRDKVRVRAFIGMSVCLYM